MGEIDYNDFTRYLVTKKRYEPSTVRQTVLRIKKLVSLSPQEIGSGLEQFIFENKSVYKPSTFNAYLKAYKALQAYLKDRKLIEEIDDSFEYFDDARPHIEILNQEEKEVLLNYWLEMPPHAKKKEEYINRLWQDVTLFLIMTGARFEELANLKVKHVFEKYVLFVDTKNKTERTVPYINPLADRIQKRIEGKSSEEFVFCNSVGKPLDNHKFNDWLKRAGEGSIRNYKARCHAHMLRHVFAMDLRRRGVDISTIKRLMGHKNIKTTDYYMHIDDQEAMDAVKRLPEAMNMLSHIEIIENVTQSIESLTPLFSSKFIYSISKGTLGLEFKLQVKDEKLA